MAYCVDRLGQFSLRVGTLKFVDIRADVGQDLHLFLIYINLWADYQGVPLLTDRCNFGLKPLRKMSLSLEINMGLSTESDQVIGLGIGPSTASSLRLEKYC